LDGRNEFWAFEVPYILRNRGRQLKILPDRITPAIGVNAFYFTRVLRIA
jgi:hypothetical protein